MSEISLELLHCQYNRWMTYDGEDGAESLVIPVEDLIKIIRSDKGVADYIVEEMCTAGGDIERLDDETKLSIVEDLGYKVQPEYWKMNAHDFKRHLCDMLDLNYHTSERDILRTIDEKMLGIV